MIYCVLPELVLKMPELVLKMLESALPLPHSTCPAGSSSGDQHWQSGQQPGPLRHSTCPGLTYPSILAVWAAAWPFASLNLPGPYLPLDTGSLGRGATAAGPQLPSSRQSKFNLNTCWQVDPIHFEFQRVVTNFEVEVSKKPSSI